MKYPALNKQNLSIDEFIKICNESLNIPEALLKLNLHRTTFTKYAKHLNCFNPKQGGKGGTKNIPPHKFSIEKWDNNINMEMARSSIRMWIFRLELLPICCNKCKNNQWLGNSIPLELNHIDGNGHNNIKSNLELLCPNCHALTDTYRGKNITLKYGKSIPKIKDKNKSKEYWQKHQRKSLKKPREQYLMDMKNRFEIIKKEEINLITNSDIDVTKYGWSIKMGKLINKTPQYTIKFIKNYMPGLWELCKKHKN